MQTQALTITATEGPRTVDGALRALRAVSGVEEAAFSPRTDAVMIRFDQERTSPQELYAALIAAGYDTLGLVAPDPLDSDGLYCGSCEG